VIKIDHQELELPTSDDDDLSVCRTMPKQQEKEVGQTQDSQFYDTKLIEDIGDMVQYINNLTEDKEDSAEDKVESAEIESNINFYVPSEAVEMKTTILRKKVSTD